MKWIGQLIYDQVSRFRNDVYLESISTGTIASGAHLGLDSNNKIVKAADGGGDLTSIVAGTGLSGTSLTGPIPTLNVEPNQPEIVSLGTLTGLTIDGDKNVTPGDGAMLHIDTSTITDNNTSASGTASLYTHVKIEGPTLAATNSSVTTTDAATLYITRPTNGTNQTFTNTWGVYNNGSTYTSGLNNVGHYTQTAGDITLYDATNNGNPTISLGSSATERLKIESIYESGAQGLDEVRFTTHTAGSSANDGRFTFYVDETNIFQIKDSLVNIAASGKLTIGNVDILSDSSGTTTLNNIDALDATTEATIESAIDTLSNLTTVGTIGTGVWQGTAVASAYLDADTAHYSAQRQLTHHMILDDIDTSVVYISLGELDAESGTASNKALPLLAPTAGKLLKVFLRTTNDTSAKNLTWKLYTRTTSQSTNGNATEIGAQTGAGPTNKTMVTYDFTTGLDSGTNVIAAGDKVLLSIESDASTSNGSYFITLMWEWDLS